MKELRNSFLIFCILVNISIIYSTSTFRFTSSDATVTIDGNTYTGAQVVADGPTNAQRITFNFANGQKCLESEFYSNNARYQICNSTGNTNICSGYYISLDFPAYDLINPNNNSTLSPGATQTIAGLTCREYSYTYQGVSTKIYAQNTNSSRICKIIQTGNGLDRTIVFNTFATSTTTLTPPNDYPSCIQDVQCGSAIDLALVIDQSGSINTTEFQQQTTYVKNLVNSFVMGNLGVKITYILFSSSVNVTSQLTGTKSTIINAIDNTVQAGGETNIGDAILTAHNELKSTRGRAGVPNTIILLTDGVANLPLESATGVSPGLYAFNAATTAKNAGDTIFVVSVGVTNTTSLASISSGPGYIASVSDFAALQSTLTQILQTVCDGELSPCESGGLSCNNNEFCGCGSCICTVTPSVCGSRGTFNANDCSCTCSGNWENVNGDLTCSTCKQFSCSNGGTRNPYLYM